MHQEVNVRAWKGTNVSFRDDSAGSALPVREEHASHPVSAHCTHRLRPFILKVTLATVDLYHNNPVDPAVMTLCFNTRTHTLRRSQRQLLAEHLLGSQVLIGPTYCQCQVILKVVLQNSLLSDLLEVLWRFSGGAEGFVGSMGALIQMTSPLFSCAGRRKETDRQTDC